VGCERAPHDTIENSSASEVAHALQQGPDQLRAQRQSFDAQPPDRKGLEAFIRSYLSPQHRDQFADACPSAALLAEIARRPAATKQVFTDELMGVIDDIASRLDPAGAGRSRR
jgi:TetR/AcrR family transcriptional regulator, transcriptional repressor for nem operon